MSKKKVYLIPGTMCNEQLWSYIVPSLVASMGKNYEFVHVKIPKDKCFIDISKYLADLFKDERAIIIGFSLGGYIAAHFSATFPERVDKIFSIANSPCALYPLEEKQRQAIVKFVNRYGYQGMSKVRAKQLLDSENITAHQLAHFIDTMLIMDASLGESEFTSQMNFTSQRTDLFELLIETKVKSVFYYSERDLLVNAEWLNKLQSINTQCTMICTSGASHMLPFEKPEELIGHIQAWLNQA